MATKVPHKQTPELDVLEQNRKFQSFWSRQEKGFIYLYERWLDERKYEDFAEFKKAAIRFSEGSAFEIHDMHKRPFTIQFLSKGELVNIIYTVKMTLKGSKITVHTSAQKVI